EFTKETDIMDVRFDSGSSHQGVMATRPELEFPETMVLEGSDQYRGWFNSSLITSVAVTGKAPYKEVVSQGFNLDGNGEKMSNSIGNNNDPYEVITKIGAAITRLSVSTEDRAAVVRVSVVILSQTSETYRNIRKTMRFLLAKTTHFNTNEHAIAYNDPT